MIVNVYVSNISLKIILCYINLLIIVNPVWGQTFPTDNFTVRVEYYQWELENLLNPDLELTENAILFPPPEPIGPTSNLNFTRNLSSNNHSIEISTFSPSYNIQPNTSFVDRWLKPSLLFSNLTTYPYPLLSGINTLGTIFLLKEQQNIYTQIQTLRNPTTDILMNGATFLGDGLFTLGLSGGMYLLGNTQTKQVARMCIDSFLLSGIQTTQLKIYTGENRPGNATEHLGFSLKDDSFPSGHTATAFSLATILSGNYGKPWLFYGLAGLVGFSRAYLTSHWLHDTIPAAFIGYAAGRHILQTYEKNNPPLTKGEAGGLKNWLTLKSRWQFSTENTDNAYFRENQNKYSSDLGRLTMDVSAIGIKGNNFIPQVRLGIQKWVYNPAMYLDGRNFFFITRLASKISHTWLLYLMYEKQVWDFDTQKIVYEPPPFVDANETNIYYKKSWGPKYIRSIKENINCTKDLFGLGIQYKLLPTLSIGTELKNTNVDIFIYEFSTQTKLTQINVFFYLPQIPIKLSLGTIKMDGFSISENIPLILTLELYPRLYFLNLFFRLQNETHLNYLYASRLYYNLQKLTAGIKFPIAYGYYAEFKYTYLGSIWNDNIYFSDLNFYSFNLGLIF